MRTDFLRADHWYQFNDDEVHPLSSFYNLQSGDAAKPIIIEDEDVNMDAVESEGDASSDEYIDEAPQPKRKRGTTSKTPTRKTRQKKVELIDSDDDGDPLNRPLTARQKLECLHAFSLFFPVLITDSFPLLYFLLLFSV